MKRILLFLGLVFSFAQAQTYPQANTLITISEENFGKIDPNPSSLILVHSTNGYSLWRMIPNDRKTPASSVIRIHPTKGNRYMQLPLLGSGVSSGNGGTTVTGPITLSQIADFSSVWPPKFSDITQKPTTYPSDWTTTGNKPALLSNMQDSLTKKVNVIAGKGVQYPTQWKKANVNKGSPGAIAKIRFVGNGANLSNAGDSLTITVQKDYVTLEEFGGAADGTTDNYAAFNLAKAAGKKLLLGPGEYGTTRTWTIDVNGFELAGSGKFVTTIKPLSGFVSTDSALVSVGYASMLPSNVTIRDVRIAATFTGGDNVSGLRLYADYNTDVYNCWFQGGNYTGSRNVGGVYIRQSKHLRFTDCNFTNSYSYGIYVRGGAYDDTMFRGCQFDENQADFVVINTGYFQDLKILECSFGHTYESATNQTPIRHVVFKNTTGGGINRLMVTNCTFSNTLSSYTNTAFDLLSPSGMVLIQSNIFENYNKWAIIKTGSGSGLSIIDNDFRNNGRSRGVGTVYTDVAANNPDASPYFYSDIWIGDGGYYGGRVARNTTDATNGILVCARPSSNDINYQNVDYDRNKAYTHGRILGVPETASVAPSSGSINYKVGEYVINSTPSELGSSGSKYIIKGWTCTVSGYPSTFIQDRSLTGN